MLSKFQLRHNFIELFKCSLASSDEAKIIIPEHFLNKETY